METVKTKDNKTKITIFKISFVIVFLLIAVLLFMLFKNIIVEIIRLTKANDQEGIKVFMQSKGWLGYLAVVMIEALEMIVVVVSAEFIQIPAGLAFNFFIAILLCDLGVCIGASIVYFFVNILKMDDSISIINKSNKKLEKKLENVSVKKKEKKTQILMYLLFVTPLVPFGAICYFGSSRKISYLRYLFTCATGVIPSIITSILMGSSIKYYISSDLPLWKLVLIIFFLGAILLAGMFFISRKYLLGNKRIRNTPNSLYSYIANFIFSLYVNKNSKYKITEDEMYEKLSLMTGPKLYLANHLSANDMYHCYKITDPDKPALVVNKYYTRNKVTRFFIKKLGFIPKSLFSPDVLTIRKILKYKEENTSILMFPEAKLSIDGTSNPVSNGTAELVKKLDYPLVIIELSGNYYANSKIRTAKRRCPVNIKIKEILTKDEINNMSPCELDKFIREKIYHSEDEFALYNTYKDKNKAYNLEKVLYYCPKCHQEFKLHSFNNTLKCECGFELELNEHYRFSDNEFNLSTIHDYYSLIKNHEKEVIDSTSNFELSQEVIVKKLSFKDKKLDEDGEGTTRVTREGFSFEGVVGGKVVTISHTFKTLQALPFSVNEEYECYYNDELYYFYPKNVDRASCTKVALVYDILYEENK